MDKIINFSIEQGYKGAKYIGKWRNYEIYDPIYNKEKSACIGFPLVIIVDNDIIRMSTEKECVDFLEYQILSGLEIK